MCSLADMYIEHCPQLLQNNTFGFHMLVEHFIKIDRKYTNLIFQKIKLKSYRIFFSDYKEKKLEISDKSHS